MTASILLVDDDAALLRALPDALRLRLPDLEITTAPSAAEARRLAAANEYDAIVTDIKMPGTDGLELLAELRLLRPGTPTLLITGHGERDLAIQALRGGAYDFVQKPIDRDYIAASLDRAIQSSRLTRQLEAQRQALARHAHVLREMSEAVFVVGGDGRVDLWNDAAALVTGVTAGAAVGERIDALFSRWPDIAVEIAIDDREPGCSAPPTIVPVDTPAGELWLSFHAVRFDNGVIYTFRDTRVDRSVDELKSEFLATVSHELRTPLSAIYGAATTLNRREALAPTLRDELLRMLVDETMRLRRLVEDLLSTFALESDRIGLNADAIDSVSLVQRVADAVRIGSRDDVTITLDVPDELLPPLVTDGDKLRQVLTNLIENALKYSPSGSDVAVGIERREAKLRFYVRDHGPGIAPDEQRRIFDKFYRVASAENGGVRGSGLGLYVSRELVRRMEGRIGVRSVPSSGSTFFVDLPLVVPAAQIAGVRA
jgi:signal transduction histidine kinase